MGFEGSGNTPISDEEALDVRANELLASHGRRAMQVVVDEIQHALRAGDEATARRQHRLLEAIDRKLSAEDVISR